MIDKINDAEDNLQRFVICPNRAMSWNGQVVFFLTISTITLGIGVWFFVNGFPLVLPFSGIELLLLGYALYITSWRATIKEVIVINGNTVAVETGHKKREKSYQFERLWTTVILEKPIYDWYPSRLLIQSQDKQLEIGGFLNEEERQGLAKQLDKALTKT